MNPCFALGVVACAVAAAAPEAAVELARREPGGNNYGEVSNGGRTYTFESGGSGFGMAWVRTESGGSGKRYFEVVNNGPTLTNFYAGFTSRALWQELGSYYFENPLGNATYMASYGTSGGAVTGRIDNGNFASDAAYVWNAGDVCQIAVDFDTGKVWYGKNGTWLSGDPAAGTGNAQTLPSADFDVMVGFYRLGGSTRQLTCNFADDDFAYTPPGGFSQFGATPTPPSFTYSNTVLRLPLDGADAATAATDYSPNVKTITFHGNAQIDMAESKWGGAALLLTQGFERSWIQTTTAMADFRFGTSDFTLGCWLKTTAANQVVFDFYASSTPGTYQLYINGSGLLEWYRPGSATITATGSPVNTGAWVWVAAARVGSLLKLIVNGTEVASVSDTVDYNSTVVTSFAIGAQIYQRNASYDFAGHIDDVLVLNGEGYLGLPGAAFPVLDPNFGNISLLLPLDGPNGSTTIADFSGSPKTVTAHGTAQISTVQSKFNGASLRFDGSGRVSTPDHASLRYATGNFTHKLWLRLDNNTQTAIVLNKADATGFYPWQLFVNAGKLALRGFTSGEVLYSIETASAVPANQWLHVAAVRVDNTVTLYVDGVSQGSATLAGPALFENAGAVQIGAYGTGTFGLLGYVDDLCLRAGAEFTANFTPPTGPQPTA